MAVVSVNTTEILAIFTVVVILLLQVRRTWGHVPRLASEARCARAALRWPRRAAPAPHLPAQPHSQYGLSAIRRLTERHRHLEQMIE